MAYIDATAHARVHVLDRLQHVEWRMPDLVFRPMVMNCELKVIFLHELLNFREDIRRRIAGNDDPDPGTLAILKLASDIVVIVFGKVDRSGSMKLDIGS